MSADMNANSSAFATMYCIIEIKKSKGGNCAVFYLSICKSTICTLYTIGSVVQWLGPRGFNPIWVVPVRV